jgi:pimeloyl-ACP methyl ester carboxylesterase
MLGVGIADHRRVEAHLAGTDAESNEITNPPAQSQINFEGSWEGILAAGSIKLRLTLNVIKNGAGFSATLDSPDQAASGLPIDNISLSGATVRFEMKSLDALYEGKLVTDSEIQGHWRQQGQEFPLNFKRAAKATGSHLKVEKADAGGHSLRLLRGGEGAPTVILEGGFAADIAAWSRVQGEIANFAQVVSYDRAGLGQSDPGPKPRSAEQIALELHTALQNAGIKPPYVLVGHSLGGYFVRVFGDKYPREVVGMVLIDPSQETFDDWLKAHPAPEVKDAETQIAKAPQGVRDEDASLDSSAEQARMTRVPPGIPVTLLTARQHEAMSSEERDMWTAKQKEWIEKIPGGRFIVADSSGHLIQLHQPQLVIDAIRQVVNQVRR